jgi:hypothetical protein
MSLSIDETRFEANSRLTAIRLTMLTLRCMETWRRNVTDADSAMILVAVVAITAERLTRHDLQGDLRNMAQPVPADQLAPCNISSIAAATGLNRETARRRVNSLIERGFLTRSDDGVIGFVPGHLQKEYIHDMVRSQLDSVVGTVNNLVREGTVVWQDGTPP